MPRENRCQEIPSVTRSLIQQELDSGFIEELPSIQEAEHRCPKGIALSKLGVVHADNRDPHLVLDSTICGMNGRYHLPEKQRLPNLRHVSHFLSTCPPLQEEWQGASIDIKAAHKRMLIKEEEDEHSFSNSRTKPMHTVQLILVQKPVPGTGAGSQEHFYDLPIHSFIFATLPRFMWMTSSSSSPNLQLISNLHLQLFLYGLLEPHYLGRNWNLTLVLNGMVGLSNQLS